MIYAFRVAVSKRNEKHRLAFLGRKLLPSYLVKTSSQKHDVKDSWKNLTAAVYFRSMLAGSAGIFTAT